MSFIADKQTLEDLNLLGKYRNNSIYNLFNTVQTAGGARLLDQMFNSPLTDANTINKRSSIFKYFQEAAYTFPLTEAQYKGMESYLSGGSSGSLLATGVSMLRLKSLKLIGLQQEFNTMKEGFLITIKALNTLYDFYASLYEQPGASPIAADVQKIIGIFGDKRLNWLRTVCNKTEFSFIALTRYDYLLRAGLAEEMKSVLHAVYALDVYISVAALAKHRGFSYAHALPAGASSLRIMDCRHPALQNAVGNPVVLSNESNMIFLTGANMAGKSTFMKSFGISIYLAHMGFPVAVKEMEFPVMDGIYSSINVPDNLNAGYSHFYAEVLRVKKVAEEVSQGKNLVVIFDELFKGTNVKDAFDATLSCTEAFAAYRNCFFIISTHIIEAGKALQETCNNLQFVYMPTIMEGTVPRYPYTLTSGITSDRHGMTIIENEGIRDMLMEKAI